MRFTIFSCLAAIGLAQVAASPISAGKVCNVLDFGGVADDSTDIGPAIFAAYAKCVQGSPQSTLLIPPGTYALKKPVTLGGSAWTFKLQPQNWTLDGEGGVINGQGFLWRTKGPFFYAHRPRLVRVDKAVDFKIFGLTLVDSPMFHLVTEGGTRGEIHDITVLGAQIGATDGID
ncbi:pectin lyase fold/virulence factor, partial [Blyttiomyces helicus]